MEQRRGYKGKKRAAPRRYSARETERTTMLNLGRLTAIKYDLREIMTHHKVDEAIASTVIASVIAKGSRISIDSARTYVLDQERAGLYSRDVSEEICDLLDHNSKLR